LEDIGFAGSVLVERGSTAAWSLRFTHSYEPSVLTQPSEQWPPSWSSGSAHSSISAHQKTGAR
jgi:hypothetical protein